jgi:heterodisulfide reductase subunit B
MTTLAYYPGCTLKTKAANLEVAALAALEKVGVAYHELTRWNCCGAVFNLADDDLIHHMAPVRDLIRVQQAGAERVFTLCSQCYNTLARANQVMLEDETKRDTINTFMDEEPDYFGEVVVIHYLQLLRDQVGWDRLREAVVQPLDGLKVAPFYGCTLVRPTEVRVEDQLLEDFLRALGAEPVAFRASTECCGSYQMVAHPEEGLKRAATVLGSAGRAGAEAMVLSCPLCEYNLGARQEAARAADATLAPVPTFYFTQLLGIALGLDPASCRLDLNHESARALVDDRFAAVGA